MTKAPRVRIVSKKTWGDYILLTLRAPQMASRARPGQFVMVRIREQSDPLLRRPFGIHSADREYLEIFFQKCGVGTRILGEKRTGDYLDILGPLGQGFSAQVPSDAALLGGGRGIAPLYFLARDLISKKVKVRVYYGGKSALDLPLNPRFAKLDCRLICTTEDGTEGIRGLVTTAFQAEAKKIPPQRIYACGPDAMLEAVANFSASTGIPAELSLESIMGCGFGACWGCVQRIRRGDRVEWRKICEDGPVFEAKDILWREKRS